MMLSFRTTRWYRSLKCKISRWSLRIRRRSRRYLGWGSRWRIWGTNSIKCRRSRNPLSLVTITWPNHHRLIKIKCMNTNWIASSTSRECWCHSFRIRIRSRRHNHKRNHNSNSRDRKTEGTRSRMKPRKIYLGRLLRASTTQTAALTTSRVSNTLRAWPKVVARWKMWSKESLSTTTGLSPPRLTFRTVSKTSFRTDQ